MKVEPCRTPGTGGAHNAPNSTPCARPGYRAIFYEALPESLETLHHDSSPANQVRASVTYNHIVEGTLALTGYYSWNKICRARGILPGMQEVIRRIGDDERRHMAWGTFTCRRHVAADERHWETVQQRMDELLPHAVEQIRWRPEGRMSIPPSGSTARSCPPTPRTARAAAPTHRLLGDNSQL